jgi:O-antigen/teichoic acid export membrane protein
MRTRHAINNILLQTITLVSGIVLYFFITPFIVEKLGNEGYGINQLLLQTIGYFGIAEMGVGISLSVLLYKELANNATDNINALLSAAQRVYLFIGFSIAVAGGVFSFYLTDIFSIAQTYKPETHAAFLLYLSTAVLTYCFGVPGILLNTSQKGYKTYIYQLLKPFLTYGGYAFVVYKGYSIAGIAFVSFVLSVWHLIAVNRKARAEFPWMNIWFSQKNYAIVQTSKYVFVEKVLMLVLFQTDVILISYFLGVGEVTGYALYTVFFYYIKELILIGSNNIVNGAGELYQEGGNGVYLLWRDSMSIVFFIATQVCVGIYFLFPYFFNLWISDSLLLSQTILLFFVINLFHIITLHPTVMIVSSQNYYKKRISGSVAEIVLNVVISCILIPRIGIVGALIGTALGHYCVNAWFIPMLFFQSIKKSFKQYIGIFISYISILMIVALGNYFYFKYVLVPVLNNITHWGAFVLAVLLYIVVSVPFSLGLYYFLDPNYTNAVQRIRGIFLLLKRGK